MDVDAVDGKGALSTLAVVSSHLTIGRKVFQFWTDRGRLVRACSFPSGSQGSLCTDSLEPGQLTAKETDSEPFP